MARRRGSTSFGPLFAESALTIGRNYGVTDRWDIGVAVPFVRVNLDARVEARILRLVTRPRPSAPLLISASVLFPLTDAGLRSRLTTVIGVDYAFSRRFHHLAHGRSRARA